MRFSKLVPSEFTPVKVLVEKAPMIAGRICCNGRSQKEKLLRRWQPRIYGRVAAAESERYERNHQTASHLHPSRQYVCVDQRRDR